VVPCACHGAPRRCQGNGHCRRERDASIRAVPAEPCRLPLASPVPAQSDPQSHTPRVRGPVSRRLATVGTMAWTLVVTILRADRLPNEFAREHWFIDYRFGFVKRGLVGSVVSLATRLARIDATERLIDALSIGFFLVFCLVVLALGLRLIRRSGWSTTVTLAVLVFLSSPFMVMIAHL